MTLAVAIASVTLSLANTNDYTFTHPTSTNLCGVGMGDVAGLYGMLREEDLIFLREAWTERMYAIQGRSYGYSELPDGEPFVRPGWNGSHTNTLAWMFSESFDDNKYWHLVRGRNTSFVAEDFKLNEPPESGTFFDCQSNWTVRIGESDYKYHEGYIPFVSTFGTRIVPPDLHVKTNYQQRGVYANDSYYGVSRQDITNSYANLRHTHDIVASSSFGAIVNRTDGPIGDYKTLLYEYQTYDVNYTDVRDSDGNWKSSYASSIQNKKYLYDGLRSRYNIDVPIYGSEIPVRGSGPSIADHHIYQREILVSGRLDNPDEDDRSKWTYSPVTYGDVIAKREYKTTHSLSNVPYKVVLPIETNDWHLVSNLKLSAVVLFRRSLVEKNIFRSSFNTNLDTEAVIDAYDLYAVGQFPVTPSVVSNFEGKVFIMAPSHQGPSTALKFFKSHCGDRDDGPVAHKITDFDMMLPNNVGFGSGSVTATDDIEITYTIMWIGFLATYHRDFRAKIIEGNQ